MVIKLFSGYSGFKDLKVIFVFVSNILELKTIVIDILYIAK